MLIIIDIVLVQTIIISHLDYVHSFLISFPFLSSMIVIGLPRDIS